jgi:hypothetical protein
MKVTIWNHGTIGESCGDQTFTVAKKRVRTVPSYKAIRLPDTCAGQTMQVVNCPKCGMRCPIMDKPKP